MVGFSVTLVADLRLQVVASYNVLESNCFVTNDVHCKVSHFLSHRVTQWHKIAAELNWPN